MKTYAYFPIWETTTPATVIEVDYKNRSRPQWSRSIYISTPLRASTLVSCRSSSKGQVTCFVIVPLLEVIVVEEDDAWWLDDVVFCLLLLPNKRFSFKSKCITNNSSSCQILPSPAFKLCLASNHHLGCINRVGWLTNIPWNASGVFITLPRSFRVLKPKTYDLASLSLCLIPPKNLKKSTKMVFYAIRMTFIFQNHHWILQGEGLHSPTYYSGGKRSPGKSSILVWVQEPWPKQNLPRKGAVFFENGLAGIWIRQ